MLTESAILATFPRGDGAFHAYVRTCIEQAAPGELDDPAALQRCLRRWHTRAIVRVQSDLAALGPVPTWYACRDGQAGMTSERDWWSAPGTAAVTFDGRGVFLEADVPAHELAAREPGSLPGTAWTELVPPGARNAEPDWIWRVLAADGIVDSVFDVPLPDGSRRVIEYHAERTAEPGVFRAWWRELTVLDLATVQALARGAGADGPGSQPPA